MNIVVKYGGSIARAAAADDGAADDGAAGAAAARNGIAGVVLDAVARHDGRVAIVHGGGPHISDALGAAGIESSFVAGLRVTTTAAMPIVENALLDVNRSIVAALRTRGRNALGVDGRDGRLFACERAVAPSGESLGRVGHVLSANAARIEGWWRSDLLPVIAPLGTLDGRACNVNADEVAGALAGRLGVPAIFVTDVPGIVIGARVRTALALDEIDRAIQDGHIHGGMIPKVLACARAVRCGAPYAAIGPAGPEALRGGTRIYATKVVGAL